METFELILILLGCVILSAPLDQILKKISLPLSQIVLGFVVALFIPQVADVQVDPELFLVVFIAPLLFNEARKSHRRDLWNNKASILSLAIGLVLLTVLVVGFVLHWLVPSIPLAAAFACAGALGPTDAAAVSALGSTISLSRRQKTLLSGEALINDASGVVSFQFAIAAALTGAFSVVDAGVTFLVLFFGGIAAGLLMGVITTLLVAILRRRGFENTVVHVLYEVMTPFVVFLAAETINVSGILAVVAAGLVIANSRNTLTSAESARQQVLSNSVWEVIVFLINGILFVLLGMQLPQAMLPSVAQSYGAMGLIGITLLLTTLVIGVRFIWVAILECIHRDEESGQRGWAHKKQTFKSALITTIAGPKGAVTLSIIFTLPFVMPDGSAFPERHLIIFLTSGIILCTLLLANFGLPRLAGEETDDQDLKRHVASISVLEATIARLRDIIKNDEQAEYVPAMRLVVARYRARLFRERIELDNYGDVMRELLGGVLDRQEERLEHLRAEGRNQGITRQEAASYYPVLQTIRASAGYTEKRAKVGSRLFQLWGQLLMYKEMFFPSKKEDAESQRRYYDACLFAIDLEKVAIDYLEEVASQNDGTRSEIAQVLADEHRSICESFWSRINYHQEHTQDSTTATVHEVGKALPDEMQQTFSDQFSTARQYADEADARALAIELEEINKLYQTGKISKQLTHELRESVYLMQMSLAG